jgi:glycosyltransferase involved in cell wall biosynthesis
MTHITNSSIAWLTNSYGMIEGLNNNLITSGGEYYNIEVAKILMNHFDFDIDERFIREEKEHIVQYWRRVQRLDFLSNINILDPIVISFGKLPKDKIKIGMIHHFDFVKKFEGIKYLLYFKRLQRRLQKLDHIVTVSKYWSDYLYSIGCKKVSVIYNSFDIKEFELIPINKNEFVNKYGLDSSKPIIYLGPAQIQKGYSLVASSIDYTKYNLLVTGNIGEKDERIFNLGYLDRVDYISMLKSSDLVITYSTMLEGWNRIAHEALLCKVPVIGSGIGGMHELLSGAQQKIVNNLKNIDDTIKFCVENKNSIGQLGYNYVIKFDHKYFENSWLELLNNILVKT